MSNRNYRKLVTLGLLAVLFILSSCSPKSSTRIEQEFDEQEDEKPDGTVGRAIHPQLSSERCPRVDIEEQDNP